MSKQNKQDKKAAEAANTIEFLDPRPMYLDGTPVPQTAVAG